MLILQNNQITHLQICALQVLIRNWLIFVSVAEYLNRRVLVMPAQISFNCAASTPPTPEDLANAYNNMALLQPNALAQQTTKFVGELHREVLEHQTKEIAEAKTVANRAEGRFEQLFQENFALFREVKTTVAQLEAKMEEVKSTVARLETKIDKSSELYPTFVKNHQRELHLDSVKYSNATTQDIIAPPPNSQNMKPQNFPKTLAEAAALSLSEVTSLLQFYGFNPMPNSQRYNLLVIFACRCGFNENPHWQEQQQSNNY